MRRLVMLVVVVLLMTAMLVVSAGVAQAIASTPVVVKIERTLSRACPLSRQHANGLRAQRDWSGELEGCAGWNCLAGTLPSSCLIDGSTPSSLIHRSS